MLPPLVISIFFLLIAALASATFPLTDSVTALKLISKERAQLAVSKSVESHYLETSVFPSSLKQMADGALGNQSGAYWHLREFLPVEEGSASTGNSPFAVAPTRVEVSNQFEPGLDPDFFRYFRVAVYSPLTSAFDDSVFLSAAGNKCSSGSFQDALIWCGDRTQSLLWSTTDRALSANIETNALAQQRRTAEKFVVRYRAVYGTHPTSAFPPAASATLLRTVATAVGTSVKGTSKETCSGVFHWRPATPANKSIPLECSDFYNYWGNLVSYRKIGNREILLTSESKYFDASGAALKVVSTSVVLTY